jgi:hypothetical protein
MIASFLSAARGLFSQHHQHRETLVTRRKVGLTGKGLTALSGGMATQFTLASSLSSGHLPFVFPTRCSDQDVVGSEVLSGRMQLGFEAVFGSSEEVGHGEQSARSDDCFRETSGGQI